MVLDVPGLPYRFDSIPHYYRRMLTFLATNRQEIRDDGTGDESLVNFLAHGEKRSGKKSTPLQHEGGKEGEGVIEANYKGRITGSWATRATISLLELSRERAIHVARELFVLRRIGNIIIGVIASQNQSRIPKGVTRVTGG